MEIGWRRQIALPAKKRVGDAGTEHFADSSRNRNTTAASDAQSGAFPTSDEAIVAVLRMEDTIRRAGNVFV